MAIEAEKAGIKNAFSKELDKHNKRVKKLSELNKRFVAMKQEASELEVLLQDIVDEETELQEENSEYLEECGKAKEVQRIIDRLEDAVLELENFYLCDDLTDY